ncbi:2OG-Fe(II) oxygenase family protein [Scytonema sp. NUACC26]|uniref:2OG-Fe(II) oxygenase family protein n=1 Tax=Scytonema sp. NUACC26 TaxID=3140176 RepID=UPI0034DC8EF5
MLNMNAIAQATMQEFPYRWAFVQNLFSEKSCLELANSFPQEGFHVSGSIVIRKVFVEAENQTEQQIKELLKLNKCWQDLINDLLTSAYRDALEQLTSLNLMDDFLWIYFFRYDTNMIFNPHTDVPSSRLVHLFYFNQEWDSNWGGCLRILKDDRPESMFQEIPPLVNTSVILVNSDNAWHNVNPIVSDAPQERLVLKVAFSKRE